MDQVGPGAHGASPDLATRLAQFARSATRLQASLSVQDVMDRVVEEAVGLVGAHRGVVILASDRSGRQRISTACPSERGAADRRRDEPQPAGLTAPLLAKDGHDLGVIQLSDTGEGGFTAEDEAVLEQLAAIAAITVENADRYERQRDAAQRLQRELPHIDGLSLASRYIAGERGARVGGDWYDVIVLDDHRVAMVVGDVMGRGISAASAMGQLRIGVRAYALQDRSPGEVLEGVDALLDSLGDHFATLLYCVWDLRRNSVMFASAGHLPPLLRLPDRRTVFLRGEQGLPLGVERTGFSNHQVDVPVGSTLMLYTDGLVEDRGVPLSRTLGTLAQAGAAAPDDPDALAQEVLHGLPSAGHDDVALVVARRADGADAATEPEPAGDIDRRLGLLRFPPDTECAGRVRRWAAHTLTREGLDDLVDNAELLVSEVAANAIVHASTDVDVEMWRQEGRVRVTLSDAELQLPSVAALDLEATGGRGMHLVDLLAADWGVYMQPQGKTVWFELAT